MRTDLREYLGIESQVVLGPDEVDLELDTTPGAQERAREVLRRELVEGWRERLGAETPAAEVGRHARASLEGLAAARERMLEHGFRENLPILLTTRKPDGAVSYGMYQWAHGIALNPFTWFAGSSPSMTGTPRALGTLGPAMSVLSTS